MSESRIVVEQPCEHGNVDCFRDHPDTPLDKCPGGRRRVLTAGEYLLVEKVDGEWRFYESATAAHLRGRWYLPDEEIVEIVGEALDALAKSEQEGTE